ncbi:MAG: hypothetical protein GX971_07975, partial [Firmicutes bacterium]|nr:hypothetical protein [Bacillota bacterium]
TNISLGLRSNLSQATYTLRVLSALETCEPPTGKSHILDDLKESVFPTWNKQLNQLITGLPPKDRDDLARVYSLHDTTTELTRDPVETRRTEKTANFSDQELKNLLGFRLTGPLDDKPTFRLTLTLGDFAYDEAHFQWAKELRECFFNWTGKNRITGDGQRFQELVSKAHGLYQQLPTGNETAFSELAKIADQKNKCFPVFLYEILIGVLLDWHKRSETTLDSIDGWHDKLVKKALDLRTEGMQLLEKGLREPMQETIPPLEIACRPDWIWDPESESVELFTSRVRKHINKQIKHYTQTILALTAQVTLPEVRSPYHYEWLVRYQIYGESLMSIAKSSSDEYRNPEGQYKERDPNDIKDKIQQIADIIGIKLR